MPRLCCIVLAIIIGQFGGQCIPLAESGTHIVSDINGNASSIAAIAIETNLCQNRINK